RRLLAHVVAWAADGAVAAYVRRRWPAVVDVSAALRAAQESEIPNFKASYLGRFPLAALADGDAARDAPFESSAYARFAAVKALMPHAAAALRAPALTQDADVVWLGDVPAYFDARFGDANIEAVAFADSPRVDPRSRPCKRKEAPAMARYA
ncbi:hypothetical protein AURANDRAFT_69522, partial [Aureococcus anophagefferens]